MKKILRGICMVTVLALAFTACKKNEEKAAFQGSTQVFVNEGGAFEYGERAYWNNVDAHMYFEEGDQVMLFNIDDAATLSECALYHADATGTLVNFIPDEEMSTRVHTAFYGFYPGATVVPDLQNQNYAKFPVAPVPVYRQDENGRPIIAKDCLYMAAKEETTNLGSTEFHFQNICGVLVMPLYSTNTDGRYVQSIVIDDNVWNLYGDFNVKVNMVNAELLQAYFDNFDMSDPGFQQYISDLGYFCDGAKGKRMVLDCSGYENGEGEPNGVHLLAAPAVAQQFCIVLRPMALANGFTMTVNYVDAAGNPDYYQISTMRNNMIRPNWYRTFSAIDIH